MILKVNKNFIYLSVLAFSIFSFIITTSISSELFLDETSSYWVIKDSFWEAINRSVSIQNNSSLYYIILWLSSQVIGFLEISLRIPSLLFFFFSNILIYKIARKFLSKFDSYCSSLVFLMFTPALGSAMNVRTYSMTVFLLLLSMYVLLNYKNYKSSTFYLLYISSTTLMIYGHYYSVQILPLHFYLFYKIFGFKKALNRYILSLLLVFLLLLLNVKQILIILDKSQYLLLSKAPSFIDIMRSMLSVELYISSFILLIYVLIFKTSFSLSKKNKELLIFSILWSSSSVFLNLQSFITGFNAVVDRYFLFAQVGNCLLIISLFKIYLKNKRTSSVLLTFLFLFPLYTYMNKDSNDLGFRNKVIDYNLNYKEYHSYPLLITSAYVESTSPLIYDNNYLDYFSSNLVYYKTKNEEVVVLPPFINPVTLPYIDNQMSKIQDEKMLTLVSLPTININKFEFTSSLVASRLLQNGYEIQEKFLSGYMLIMLLKKKNFKE